MKKIFLLCFILMIAIFTACAVQEPVELPKTDITPEEAEQAAGEIAKEAQSQLAGAELVYVYAYPVMAEKYAGTGKNVAEVPGDTYFLDYSAYLQEDPQRIARDEDVLAAMETLGYNTETGYFTMDIFSAGMSAEITNLPESILPKIESDAARESEDARLRAAHEAYEQYINNIDN